MKITKKSNNELRPFFWFDPWENMLSPREMVHRFLNDGFLAPFLGLSQEFEALRRRFYSRVRASETETAYTLKIDVPGIDPNDIDIEVDEDSITIRGKVEKRGESDKKDAHSVAHEYNEFQRAFSFPAKIDVDTVRATTKNGVLTVVLEKQTAEKKKKVQVSVQS